MRSAVCHACDITGWPSTNHHPGAAKPVAASEVTIAYTLAVAPTDDEVRATRVAVAAALDNPAVTAAPMAGGTGLVLIVPGAIADWSQVDAAVRSTAPAATRGEVQVSLHPAPGGDAAAREHAIRSLPGAVLARIETKEGVVRLTFPPESPPPPTLVWRLRRLLAS